MKTRKTITYSTSAAGNPSSCLITLENRKYRSLLDSGAEMSLCHRRVYQSLSFPPRLLKKDISLQSVTGQSLKVDGCATLTLKIAGIKIEHTFVVVPELNRNIILGRDFLQQNQVRLYFDLNKMRIRNNYVDLEEDSHIVSLVRLKQKVVVPPQTMVVCPAKLNRNFQVNGTSKIQISAVDRGFLANEPGLLVANAVADSSRTRNIPLMLVNNTDKFMRLRRGSVVARADLVPQELVKPLGREVASVERKEKLDLSEIDTPLEFKGLVTKLVQANRDLFAAKDKELGFTDTVQMRIQLNDPTPIRLRPYRIPMNNRPIVDKAIDEMLESGIIRRSHSSFAFPVVIVDKKDGTKRFCVDFRKLNKATKTDSYPLPLIDDMLALLSGAKYFTALDLKSGYWQVKVKEEDKEKTAFTVPHRGLFEFNSMPFGLVNAPGVFQSLMAECLTQLNHFAVAYLDDILIFSPTKEAHIDHINQVFERLRQHRLRLKLKKCSFFKTETKYLGFVISGDGVSPEPERVSAMRSMSPPTNVREVRSLVGVFSYYRRFIPNFSAIAAPIIELTKKYSRFKWDTTCEKAFEYLKDSLSLIATLAYPDNSKPYILYVDASKDCVGACLTQPDETLEPPENPYFKNEKPIYFLSHRLTKTQQRWSTIEREAYALFFSLQRLNYYLNGAKIIVRTDHKPLLCLFNQEIKSKRCERFYYSIASYNVTLEYIRGDQNCIADLLSRLPDAPRRPPTADSEKDPEQTEPDITDKTYEIGYINSNRIDPKQYVSCQVGKAEILDQEKPSIDDLDMVWEQSKDPDISEIIDQLRQGYGTKVFQQRHIVLESVLYFISDPDYNPILRLYIPLNLRVPVKREFHEELGHAGIDRAYATAKLRYYWPNMFKDFSEHVSQCVQCKERSLRVQKRPLQKTEIPPFPFAKIAVDTSGPYELSHSGNRYVIAFIDLYSGWPEAFATPTKDAETVAHLFIEEIYPRFGAVLQIIHDRGTEYVNEVFRKTLSTLNVSWVTSSPYHPQANGLVEHFNKTFKNILAKYTRDTPQRWDLYINQALAAVRFSVNVSLGVSPFYAMYLRDPVVPLDNILKPRARYLGEANHLEALQRMHQCFVSVHRHLQKARERQKHYADRQAKDVEFKVGMPVFYLNHHKRSKMDPGWLSHFRIIAQLGPQTFIIRHQLTGVQHQAHTTDLQKAELEWEIPELPPTERPLRKTRLAAPQTESSAQDSSDADSESSDVRPGEKPMESAGSNKHRPPDWLIKRNKHEVSSSQDTKPRMHLQKLMRANRESSESPREDSKSDSDTIIYDPFIKTDSMASDVKSEDLAGSNDPMTEADLSDRNMVGIEAVSKKVECEKSVETNSGSIESCNCRQNVKALFQAIAQML